MEIIKIADEINEKVQALGTARQIIKDRAKEKAQKTAHYERVLAVTIVRLKNGESLNIEAYKIEKPPATIIEKIARGICWEEKLAMDEAEGLYKAAITNMNALNTEINALQSILRWMDER